MLKILNMTTIRGSLGNQWWRSMYNRYTTGDPVNQHYGSFALNQIHRPLTIDSNDQYTVDLDRHCGSLCSYNIGGVSKLVRSNHLFRRIDECSDDTGAPHMCARSYIGNQAVFGGGGGGSPVASGDISSLSRGYDRIGS